MLQLFLNLIDSEEGKSKFESIYFTYHDFLFKVAKSVTGNHHDAEDALQNALFVIAKNVDKIKTEDANRVKVYLKTIVRNSAIDLIRARKRKAFLDIETVEIADDNMIEEIEERELDNQVRRQILSMPVIYREVLVLNIINGLSPSQIADVLSLSINTVNTRLRRGRKKLEEILKDALFKE